MALIYTAVHHGPGNPHPGETIKEPINGEVPPPPMLWSTTSSLSSGCSSASSGATMPLPSTPPNQQNKSAAGHTQVYAQPQQHKAAPPPYSSNHFSQQANQQNGHLTVTTLLPPSAAAPPAPASSVQRYNNSQYPQVRERSASAMAPPPPYPIQHRQALPPNYDTYQHHLPPPPPPQQPIPYSNGNTQNWQLQKSSATLFAAEGPGNFYSGNCVVAPSNVPSDSESYKRLLCNQKQRRFSWANMIVGGGDANNSAIGKRQHQESSIDGSGGSSDQSNSHQKKKKQQPQKKSKSKKNKQKKGDKKKTASENDQYGTYAMVNKTASSVFPSAVPCSRQNSLASSGIISDIFTASKGTSYYKFSVVGLPEHFSYGAGHLVSATPMPAQSSGPVSSGRASSLGAAVPLPAPPPPRRKRDRMQELRDLWAKPGCKALFLAILVLLMAAVFAAYFLNKHFFTTPERVDISWLPPKPLRTDQSQPNAIRLDAIMAEGVEQVRVEHRGALPFRSDYTSILDFRTNKVVIMDSALRSGGRQLICFVMDLDRQSVPSMRALMKAAQNGAEKFAQDRGWQEVWNWVPSQMSNVGSTQSASRVAYPEPEQCKGARYYELARMNRDQKPFRCTECFDFCLPEYGVEKRNDGPAQMNIVRRNCFYLFVPEWRSFAQGYNVISGGDGGQQQQGGLGIATQNGNINNNQFPSLQNLLNQQQQGAPAPPYDPRYPTSSANAPGGLQSLLSGAVQGVHQNVQQGLQQGLQSFGQTLERIGSGNGQSTGAGFFPQQQGGPGGGSGRPNGNGSGSPNDTKWVSLQVPSAPRQQIANLTSGIVGDAIGRSHQALEQLRHQLLTLGQQQPPSSLFQQQSQQPSMFPNQNQQQWPIQQQTNNGNGGGGLFVGNQEGGSVFVSGGGNGGNQPPSAPKLSEIFAAQSGSGDGGQRSWQWGRR